MRKSGPSVEGMDLGENVGILVLVGMKFVKKKKPERKLSGIWGENFNYSIQSVQEQLIEGAELFWG